MIHWDVSREIFSLGFLSVRWYGLLFALGFVAAFWFNKKIFKQKKIPLQILDQLLVTTIIGTVIGARLGHCLFYEPEFYLQNPIEILFIWKGGLASHGAALGIIASCFWFSKRQNYFNFLQTLDQVSLCVPLAGAFIRIGNLMNSEIYGKPTNSNWGFVFEQIDSIPRHPVQLYEAISYLVIFSIIYLYYRAKKFSLAAGQVLGLNLVAIFSMRFVLEFFKASQADFEADLPLSMGQLLSIPFVALGLFLIWRNRLRTQS
ncbi:MAG: prolipoprotein diacylglyceryl transferase [Bdellovibrionota bacterium]